MSGLGQDYEDLLRFWIDEVGPEGWYKSDPELDAKITKDYQDYWHRARDGDCMGWTSNPRGMLALLILLDQFPRNMFRNQPDAFASDRRAVTIAKKAISLGWDLRIEEPVRQFFYLPLMHSECLEDQERCVRLVRERMQETGNDNLLHAKAHREVIRRFGRFPTRNEQLGRRHSAPEDHFLSDGGYGAVVNALRASA
ncbi:MAG: DUF924 family protein [Pseudomonadota bacterium]